MPQRSKREERSSEFCRHLLILSRNCILSLADATAHAPGEEPRSEPSHLPSCRRSHGTMQRSPCKIVRIDAVIPATYQSRLLLGLTRTWCHHIRHRRYGARRAMLAVRQVCHPSSIQNSTPMLLRLLPSWRETSDLDRQRPASGALVICRFDHEIGSFDCFHQSSLWHSPARIRVALPPFPAFVREPIETWHSPFLFRRHRNLQPPRATRLR